MSFQRVGDEFSTSSRRVRDEFSTSWRRVRDEFSMSSSRDFSRPFCLFALTPPSFFCEARAATAGKLAGERKGVKRKNAKKVTKTRFQLVENSSRTRLQLVETRLELVENSSKTRRKLVSNSLKITRTMSVVLSCSCGDQTSSFPSQLKQSAT